MKVDRCFDYEDFRQSAKRRLPRAVFDYVDRGTEEEVALRTNREAFDRIKLRPRFMVDLSKRDLACDILGARSSFPVAIAPTGASALLHRHGDLAMAKAGAAAGVPVTVTSSALTPIERIARESDGTLWFQVYMWKDKQLVHRMIERAWATGRFPVLVVTIDQALGRVRAHNLRNGFSMPARINWRIALDVARHPGWLGSVLVPYLGRGELRHANHPPPYQAALVSPLQPGKVAAPPRHEAMTWGDVRELRDLWPGKLVVKGVLSVEDAMEAVACGADAVGVSNHGGRSLDSAPSPLDVLPAIVESVKGRASILMDSGVRLGSERREGARARSRCSPSGRPALYGLAAGGQAGAEKVIEILRNEFEMTMGYLGCRRVSEIGRRVLA